MNVIGKVEISTWEEGFWWVVAFAFSFFVAFVIIT